MAKVTVIAEKLDLTTRRVNQLVTEGVISRTKRGEYDVDACVRGYIRYLRKQLEANCPADLNGERARLARLQADKIERELQLQEGRLIWADQASEAWGQQCIRIREKLQGAGTKLAPLLVGVRTATEAQKMVDSVHREVLDELSRSK